MMSVRRRISYSGSILPMRQQSKYMNAKRSPSSARAIAGNEIHVEPSGPNDLAFMSLGFMIHPFPWPHSTRAYSSAGAMLFMSAMTWRKRSGDTEHIPSASV